MGEGGKWCKGGERGQQSSCLGAAPVHGMSRLAAPWAFPGLQPCSLPGCCCWWWGEVSRPRCLPRAGGLELCRRGREWKKAGQQPLLSSWEGQEEAHLPAVWYFTAILTAIIGSEKFIRKIISLHQVGLRQSRMEEDM